MTAFSPRAFTLESEAFRSYAKRQHRAELDHSYESVAVLDGLLGEAWQSKRSMKKEEAQAFAENLCLAAGSYLGEVLVRNAGGVWDHEAGGDRMLQWWIRFPGTGGQKAHCFQAVWEFLEKGPRKSLLSLVGPYAPQLKPAGERTGRRRNRSG